MKRRTRKKKGGPPAKKQTLVYAKNALRRLRTIENDLKRTRRSLRWYIWTLGR